MLELIAIPAPQPLGTNQPVPANTTYRLDLFPDTQLEIIWENPLFLTDRIPAAFSLSFDIPATPNNLKVFGYPVRIPVLKVLTTLPVEIHHRGIIITQGELLLIEFDKNISVQFIGAVANLNQKKEMSEVDMGGVSFGEEQLIMPLIDYTSPDYAEYVQAAIRRSTEADPYPYCHAPVRTHKTEWEGDLALRGAMNAFHWYVNFFNAARENYSFDPEEKLHIPVVPFIPIHHIIASAFGDKIQNNPFAVGDMRKLVAITVNHKQYNVDHLVASFISGNIIIEYMYPVRGLAAWPQINWLYNEFMPSFRFNEFFKDILAIFGITMFRGLKHFFEYDNDVFDRKVVVNLDEHIDGDPVLIREQGKNYIFEYQGERPDFNDTIKEFDTWHDLYLDAMKAQWKEEFYYKVKDSPQVVSIKREVRGTTNQHWLESKIVKTPLGSEATKTHEETYTVSPSVKPLNMNIEQYWARNHNWGTVPGSPGDTIARLHWHVPVMPEKKPDDPPNIMLWGGIKNTFARVTDRISDKYPYLTNHHTDVFGNRMFAFSLLPEVTDGIVDSFHSRKKAWVEKDKLKIRGFFKLNSQQIKNLDMRDKFHLRGKTFYIEKIEFSLSHDGVSKSDITLIET